MHHGIHFTLESAILMKLLAVKSVLMLLGPKARPLKMRVTIVIVAKFLVDNVDVFIVIMSHRTSVQVTFHTAVIYIVLSTSTNHFIFTLEILFCLILQTTSKS